jgi:fluoroquinolone transport system permease protein
VRTLTAIRGDMRLQLRHGFYLVYLIVSVLYVLIISALPENIQGPTLTLIIFSDPAMLGFFFIGAIILLERSDNTLQSLFVTPLTVSEYFLGKVVSLTLLGVLTSFAIAAAVTRLVFDPFLLFLGVCLTAVLFVLIGIIAATRFKTVNSYIFGGGICSAVFTLPLLDFFGAVESPLFWILPTKPSLVIIGAAFETEGLSLGEGILGTAVLLVWIALAYLWARGWFNRYVLGRTPGRRRS